MAQYDVLSFCAGTQLGQILGHQLGLGLGLGLWLGLRLGLGLVLGLGRTKWCRSSEFLYPRLE